MDRNLIALVIDLADESIERNMKHLQWYITEEPRIHHWWNHFPSLFILETGLTTSQITEIARTYLGNISFLVMELDPNKILGWLPEEAGEWIERRKVRATPINQAAE